MDTKVIYTCECCGEKFEVKQGSRRRYCQSCLTKKITEKPLKK